jgi:hypothetical protein
MDDPPPEARRTLASTAAALGLAAAVALAFNPGVPLALAYDAVLPEGVTLALIRAGEAVETAGQAAGLDRPGAAVRGAMAWLGAPE